MTRKQIKKIIFIAFLLILFLIGIKWNKEVKALNDIDITASFKDENLKNAILEIIRSVEKDNTKNTIFSSDIDKITDDSLPSAKQLNLAGKNITNLQGLEVFANKGIEWIYLDWNNISDISLLKDFKTLTKITASGNQIQDISAIANLTNIENINFSNNNISNISLINGLPKLKYIYLENNQITIIPALNNLTQVREIVMAGNKITNIDNILVLNTVRDLDVSRNKIETIKTNQTNTKLEKLNISNNNITSLEGIEKFPMIKVLNASNNKIATIIGIESLQNLYNININKNEIRSIKALESLKKLQYIYLDNNHVVEFDAIENLPELKKCTYYNQTYYLAITENYEVSELNVTLSSMFKNFYNKESKLYNKDIRYEMENDIAYQIAEDKSFIIIKTEDVKKQDIVFKMLDNDNTYIYLTISWQVKPEEDVPEDKPEEDVGNTDISNIYQFKNEYVYGVEEKTTAKTFLQNLKVEAKLYRNKQELTEEKVVATGDKVKIEEKEYTIVIRGDINGDGYINIEDIMKLTRAMIGNISLKDVELLASDTNMDNYVSYLDYAIIERKIAESKIAIIDPTKLKKADTTLNVNKETDITLEVSLNNYNGDGVLGYQGAFNYDKTIFKDCEIEGINDWNITNYNKEAGTILATTKKAKANTPIAKITLTLKDEVSKQNTKIALENILVSNGNTSLNNETQEMMTIKKIASNIKKEESTPLVEPNTGKSTEATKSIPQTGISQNIVIITVVIATLGVIGFIRYKYIKIK